MLKVFNESQEGEFTHEISNTFKSVDVTSEQLGGEIIDFSDQWFADACNLIKPTKPIRDATKFTHSGAWYDGWETRRHNEEKYDWVIIKMGISSARLVGSEIDTAFFNGNHAPLISVEALYDESPDLNETIIKEDDSRWTEVIENFECGPSQKHFLLNDNGLTDSKFNYVKLKMYPDGGIARFKMYGKICHPPVTANNITDLAFVGHGGVITAYSDQHFGTANNLILPGRGHDMSDGWETKRSRAVGHVDWAIVQLCQISKYIDKIIIDTAHYRGNFPQYITLHAMMHQSEDDIDPLSNDWIELLPKSKTGPDKEHVYTIERAMNISHVKLTIIPDGGVKRLRVWGY
ncbi:similar to Saccharomyces cerevisiae YIR029W DAL2 Allantoicase, converts allantoate to urea and ureidoglycolate in the second step of allantoin degradation [Maudiozyma barnettii]|uniref:allantoicase n=1 Tax=Maudiozyma barnettii TaxID=61262 RepID=A0A8H2ZIQ1_9SACH|nr:allantoicase [Kazachstania barnettii]CAB4255198.1 similar to Saccharomyces cerevisiae YIR029W DAL2 Allantoicase, converts allantoate to urea and ureidoglycolate in the second step of allantoin degradation [Kazachstania barnettii]CAD1783485.1 similar to Saccharomyces cerevisiae YIR029W DAL2 Allantoicase, converts allantoate to urea and ureidoglycolate in the second step of allantoin degradation [Kazachstania barnettii]